MSDIKLFRIQSQKALELKSSQSELEKKLQNLIEANLEALLGVRFLASEYSTGKVHKGRIDTLGIDENDCPVILEYKRTKSENVINQGLFYLDWLMDHQAEFKLLVLEKYGKECAERVDWTSPRLLCIASDFTVYDSHAVQQISRNIDLIIYRYFGEDLLLLELVNSASGISISNSITTKIIENVVQTVEIKEKVIYKDKTVAEWLKDLNPNQKKLFELVNCSFDPMGDVQRKDLQLYIAYKRIKNFITLIFQKDRLILYLKLNPLDFEMENGFSRDMTNIGHWGTGDLEITLRNDVDFEKAKSYILLAYEGGSNAS